MYNVGFYCNYVWSYNTNLTSRVPVYLSLKASFSLVYLIGWFLI